MKRFIGLMVVGMALTACDNTAPQATVPAPEQIEGAALSDADISAIEAQLKFDTQGNLTLRDSASKVLSAEQLAFAEYTVPGLNELAASDNWAFTERSDGTMHPTGELAKQALEQEGKLSAQFCGSFIESVSWITRSSAHPHSASNVPTTCGRLSYFSVLKAWNESVRKTPSSSYWDKKAGTTKTKSMYNQFLCHTDYAFFKRSWNLEPTRPLVSYRDTVFAGCNPE